MINTVVPQRGPRRDRLLADPAAPRRLDTRLGCAGLVDKCHPDRYDVIGALICLAGVGVIMYAPRT